MLSHNGIKLSFRLLIMGSPTKVQGQIRVNPLCVTTLTHWRCCAVTTHHGPVDHLRPSQAREESNRFNWKATGSGSEWMSVQADTNKVSM